MLSVRTRTRTFVCFLGLLHEVNAVSDPSGPFLFLSVMLDEEQADWTLLASAVPSSSSCLKDDLYFVLGGFHSFFALCIQHYQI